MAPSGNIEGHIGATVLICIIVIACLGNFLVVFSVGRKMALHITSTILIIVLAINNILFNVTVLPFYVDSFFYRRWRFSHAICVMTTYIGVILLESMMFLMTSIAINRYFLIVCYANHKLVTVKVVILKVLISYAIPFILLINAFAGDSRIEYIDRLSRCNFDRVKSRTTLITLFAVGFFAPLVIIMMCYISIYLQLRKTTRQITLGSTLSMDNHISTINTPSTNQNEGNERVSNQNNGCNPSSSTGHLGSVDDPNSIEANTTLTRHGKSREILLAKMSAAVFATYIVTYLPFTMVTLVDGSFSAPRAVYITVALLMWAGTCTDPIIYAAINRHFWQAYKEILYCSCRREANQDKASNSRHSLQGTPKSQQNSRL